MSVSRRCIIWYAMWGLMALLVLALTTGSALAGQTEPTNTPRPDGSIVYIVQEGDSLLAIAITYDTTVEELLRINGLTANEFIFPGQELLVRATAAESPVPPTVAPADTIAPVVTPAGPPATSPPVGAPVADKAQLCIITYFDQNSNGQRDVGETLLPNAQTEVTQEGRIVASGQTDGSNPQCLNDLAPGDYVVLQQSPAGYQFTTVPNWLVPLAAGQSISIEFGHTLAPETEITPTPSAAAGGGESNVGTALLVSSSVVVFLLLVGAGLLVFTRRP